METKELKIQVPEGYEIDREKSTLECIKFKPINKNITYEDICKKLFKKGYYYYSGYRGEVRDIVEFDDKTCADRNNAAYINQLDKVLALNQLLNIAEYYNSRSRIVKSSNMYIICYSTFMDEYQVCGNSTKVIFGVEACFNNKEDAQAVIDNPNFREILDTIYK